MRFDVVTLFPELFPPHLAHGVTRRAFESKSVDVRLWPLRDFGDGPHARVDDRPYGGGPGMVLLVEPLERAVAAIRANRGEGVAAGRAPIIVFSPAGEPLAQPRLASLAAGIGAILVCGRYEGIDQRFIDRHADLELSLGDYVLSGGEIAALALLDGVARLLPGVLGDARSPLEESFAAGLLEGPHYSRPEVLAPNPDGRDVDAAVPAVLLSGHHAAIDRWRRDRAVDATAARRPELIEKALAQGRLDAADRRCLGARQRQRR